MCQPKSKGGKRCAAHMRGSRAATKEAEVYTNADKGLVNRVFKFLRQEGKNLPDPTQREVQDYADGQRIRARFDKELGNRDRNTLIRNWTEAREERPDGGVFHAWKNLRAETASRMRRIGSSIALAASASLVVAGCGGALDNDEPTPPPTSSPTQTQTPDSEESESSEDESESSEDAVDSEYDLGSGIVGGETQSDKHGEYTQITLSEDSPLMQYDESIVDSAVLEQYSEEEILEAQQTASVFVAEEVLDSPLVFDYSEENAQEWHDEHSGLFSPEYADTLDEGVFSDERTSFIDSNAGTVSLDENGDVIEGSGTWIRGVPNYDGGVRWDNLNLSLDRVGLIEGTEHIVFDYKATGNRELVHPAPNNDSVLTENADHDLTYSFRHEEGSWKLTGHDSVLNTTVDHNE